MAAPGVVAGGAGVIGGAAGAGVMAAARVLNRQSSSDAMSHNAGCFRDMSKASTQSQSLFQSINGWLEVSSSPVLRSP